MAPLVSQCAGRLAFVAGLGLLASCGGGDGGPSGGVEAPPAAATPGLPGAAGDSALDAQIEAIRGRYRLPALTAVSFRGTSGIVERGAVGARALGYGEAVTPEDLWHVGSLTKSMTATLAAVLVEDGRIGWETTVSAVFPDLAPGFRAEYQTVRLDELLTHTAGLETDMARAPSWGSLWTSTEQLRAQRRRLVAEYLALPPDSPRGTHSYANAGFVVAGAMLEEVTGESWEDLMRSRLFGPLGMPTAGFGAPGTPGARDQPWGHRPSGSGWTALAPGPNADNPPAVGPAGTLHASLADLAAYYRLHLEGAVGRGSFLPPSSFEKLHRPAPGTSYACGWGVTQREWARGRVLQHAGSNAYWYAVVWLAPERGAGFFAATNAAGDVGSPATDDTIGLLIRRFDAAFPGP